MTLPDLSIDWVRSVTEIDALAAEWTELESRVEDRTVQSTFDYLDTWYRNYAGSYGGDPLVGVARRGSHTVGIAPLVVRRGTVGKVPITRIDFAAHDAHAGEFLVEDDHPETITALIESLASHIAFDVVCLNGFQTTSASFQSVQNAASRLGLDVELTEHPNAFVDLQGGYEAYCDAMSRNFRRTLKRQAQKIASAGKPEVQGVHLTEGLEQMESYIDRLFGVTEASYKLKGERLADCHRDLLAQLARRFGPRGMLYLSLLSLDGKDAACVMGLVERGCYYDVTLAYAEEFAELSPGAYLIQEALKNLAAAGVQRVISRGAHDYKKRWSTAFVPTTRVFLFSPGLRGTATRLIRFSLGPLWRRFGWPTP